MNLGSLAGNSPLMIPFRPKAETDAGGGASGTTGTLIGGSTTDFFNQQRVNASSGIEGCHAGQAAVNHAGDAIYRPVSYTHLDVYKRQGQNRGCAT